MADIETSILRIGSNDLILQDAQARQDISNIAPQVEASFATDTASGSIASFPDGADNVPVKSLNVAVEPVQSGSGDPSPTNIRPISGHTQAVVTRTGKNLLKYPYSQGTYSTSGITFTVNDDGSITVNGTATATAWFRVYGNFATAPSGKLPVPSWVNANASYMISGSINDYARIQIDLYDASNNTVKEVKDTGSGALFTVTESQLSVSETCAIFIRINSGQTLNNVTIKPQIEVGTTSTAFEPYTVQTATIDLDGTRYGGTLDVGTGVLTVDREYQSITSQQISSTAQYASAASDSTSYYFNLPNVLTQNGKTSAEINADNTKCDTLLPTNGNALWNNKTKEGMTVNNKYVSVRVYASRMSGTTAAALASALPNGIEVVYPLATPQTVQLSQTQITSLTSLLGHNNIWADCGGTTVEYRADTKLYIEKLTAPTEDDMVADANIVSGQYFMVGNTLYKATANIASGGAITPNVNCTRKSLPEALNEINA